VTRALGDPPELAASSTDANVAISLGIPAVTIGAGGESGGVHTLGEWYSNRGGARGIERALLIAVAVAGVADD
jgi:di/tripeptidase